MKRLLIVVLMLLAGACAGLARPALADEAPVELAERAADPRGTWYVQQLYGRWLATNEHMGMTLLDQATENEAVIAAEPNTLAVVIDDASLTIRIYQNATHPVDFRYVIAGDEMVLTAIDEDDPPAAPDATNQIVLSRLPEGNTTHLDARMAVAAAHPVNGKHTGAKYRRMASINNLRHFAEALDKYRSEHDGQPPAALVNLAPTVGNAAVFMLPWQDRQPPDGWDTRPAAEQHQWLAEHTGYAYLPPAVDETGQIAKNDAVFFELPIFADTAQISIAFGGGYIRTLDYQDANALIGKQTGRDLMGWLEHLGHEQAAVVAHEDLPDLETRREAARLKIRALAESEEIAEQAAGDAIKENDGIPPTPQGVAGVWYLQQSGGNWTLPDHFIRIDFRDDTTVLVKSHERTMDMDHYFVDPGRRAILLFSAQDLSLIIELRYALYDDIMELTFRAVGDPTRWGPKDGTQEVLCRRPQGNDLHQQKRRQQLLDSDPIDGQGPQATAHRVASARNLATLHTALRAYEIDNGKPADTLGQAAAYTADAQRFLLPWQQTALPENWKQMEQREQVDWLNAHAGYAYIPADQRAELDEPNQALCFELPMIAGKRHIAVLFVDGSIARLAYEDADALIESQTGRDLAAWAEHLRRGEADGQ